MNSSSAFVPPAFWNFPPMFTLQPVQDTQEKQLKLWKDVILQYCAASNTSQIVLDSFPYFRNDSIERKLSPEAIRAVALYLIKQGNGEWDDIGHTVLRVLLKSPEQLATEIYNWASKVEILGTVYTIYELHSGDEYQDSGFHGTDPVLIRKALNYLQNGNKCVIIPGSTVDEDGVKFLAVA